MTEQHLNEGHERVLAAMRRQISLTPLPPARRWTPWESLASRPRLLVGAAGSLTAAALVVVLLSVGFGGSKSTPAGPGVGGESDSLAQSFSSLSQLRAAATSLAVLRATDKSTVRRVGGIAALTTTTVTVERNLSGYRLPRTIKLLQTGAARGHRNIGDVGPLVQTGTVYLAYLTRYRLRRAGPPVADTWTTVGGPQGLFVNTSSAPGTVPPASHRVFSPSAPRLSRISGPVSISQAGTS